MLGGAVLLLAVDVGNTQTLIGIFDGDRLASHWRVSTEQHRTEDEIGLLLRAQLDLAKSSKFPTSFIISSVVPPLTSTFTQAGRTHFGLEAVLVSADMVEDLPILYEPPSDVGPDRIVNAVAARELYGHPAVVVDFGTATTFDVIGAEGAYLGGVIATGIGVSADALFARAARLPRVEITRPPSVIGNSTVRSVQAGLFFGYAELVDGVIRRITAELGTGPMVIATGGWAETIGPECQSIDKIDPLLTLTGLRLIYERYGTVADS